MKRSAFLLLLVALVAYAAATLDDFNRANSNDLGANWAFDQAGDNDYEIASNTVHTTNCAMIVRYDGGSAPSNDQYAQFTLVTRGGPADNGVGPAVRIGAGDSAVSNVIFLQCGATDCRMYERTASGATYTQLGSTVSAAANGSVLKVQVIGNQATAFDDGVAIIGPSTVTLTSGRAGMWSCPSGGGGVNAVLDDFSFDTAAGGGSSSANLFKGKFGGKFGR